MELAPAENDVPEVPAQHRRTNDLRHRVLKLRWIGQHAEAEQLLATQCQKLTRSSCGQMAGIPIELSPAAGEDLWA